MKKTKYTVKYTTGFKKDYKRAIKRGLKIELLEQVVELLAMGEPLPPYGKTCTAVFLCPLESRLLLIEQRRISGTAESQERNSEKTLAGKKRI